MDIYVAHLGTNINCHRNNLWMNTTGDVLFSRPDGPSAPPLVSHAVESIIVPTTVNMLKDDTCIRFFSNFGSSMDVGVLECTWQNARLTYLDDLSQATAGDYQSKDSSHPDWSSARHPYLHHLWRDPPDHLPMNIVGRLRFDTVYSLSMEMEAIARQPHGGNST
ncbi:hypothetical protein MPER_12072 [Moniliophthora perniciosa FA553]|nr:hypothetical protein MPER_12072 [Moniliophthora perniciosa FA553]